MPSYGVGVTLEYIAWNTSTNAYVTGDVANHTLRWIKDGTASATTNSPSEVDSTNAPGVYKVVLTTTETQCQVGTLAGKSSASNVVLIGTTVSFENLPTATAGASGGLPTVDASNAVKVQSGTGANQISLSSGLVTLAGVTHTGAVIPTVTTVTNQLTAAQVATGVWQDTTAGDFTVASSIGKSLYTSGATPGATGGLFIAGTNAATTVTTAFTTTFTGNLTGSVGSVTGSVGSVATGGITAASFAAAAITSTVIATDAITSTGLAASAVAEIWAQANTELSAVPGVTGSVLGQLAWLYEVSANKITQTSTTQTLLKNDSTTTLATSTVSDDGTTFSRGKYA
jgi:hypothetical protein